MTIRRHQKLIRGGLATSALSLGLSVGCSDFDADDLFEEGASNSTDELTPADSEANSGDSASESSASETGGAGGGSSDTDSSGVAGTTASDDEQTDADGVDDPGGSDEDSSDAEDDADGDAASDDSESEAAAGGSGGDDSGEAAEGGDGGAEDGEGMEAGGAGGTSETDEAAGSGGELAGGAGGMSNSDDDDEPDEEETCADQSELCDGIDNNCNEEVDEGNACPEDCEGFAIAESGYMYCADEVSGEDAEGVCSDAGLRLVWIETEDENNALLEFLRDLLELADNAGPGGGGLFPDGGGEDQPSAYIGATDAEQEGIWRWGESDLVFWEGRARGEAPDGAYESWASGKPNNARTGQDCAVMAFEDGSDGDEGEWNDVRCSEAWPVICETP